MLNDSGPVSDETRQRIQQVASQLRYAPNGAARSLITRRTHTIGVLLPDLYGEFFSEVIRGIDLVAQRNGYHAVALWLDETPVGNPRRAVTVDDARRLVTDGFRDDDALEIPLTPWLRVPPSCCSAAPRARRVSTRSRSTTWAAPRR